MVFLIYSGGPPRLFKHFHTKNIKRALLASSTDTIVSFILELHNETYVQRAYFTLQFLIPVVVSGYGQHKHCCSDAVFSVGKPFMSFSLVLFLILTTQDTDQ